MIAALYALITLLLLPVSFGRIQLRISEALTLLPVLLPEAVPGLTVGCFVANLLGGAPWYDIVFGTLATLLAALATRGLRRRPLLSALSPALFNGIIVGSVVYTTTLHVPQTSVDFQMLLPCMALVGISEALICCTLGLGLLKLPALRHIR